jgi:hypothetical protein
MPVWGWILIVVAVVVVAAAVAWVMTRRRTDQLRDRFGPEYDRSMTEMGSRRKAESELAGRQKRREELDLRPLAPEARTRYAEEWRAVQARFVDQPGDAVHQADVLVTNVMRDRGYPMEDFEQRSADVSVDHPNVVDDYRAAHAISMAHDHDKASTEDLRQAMVHYRSLFDELLGSDDATRMRETG